MTAAVDPREPGATDRRTGTREPLRHRRDHFVMSAAMSHPTVMMGCTHRPNVPTAVDTLHYSGR